MRDRLPAGASLERVLGAFVLGLAGAAASTFPLAALARLVYPYELEWLESEILQHVSRVLAGEPLYAPPTAEFAPTIYPPVYAWLSALVARATGPGFLAPRLVSFLSALGIALVAARAARRLSGSVRGGFLAATLALAGYVPCGTVHDLARLDALWVLLLLAATAAAERAHRAPGALAAGALLALATATKQPAALFALALAGAVALSSRRAAVLLLAAWGALTLGFYAALHLQTDGWSTRYLVLVPLRVPHRPAAVLHLLRDDWLRSFAPAAGLLLLWGFLRREERPGGPFPAVWWAGLGAALAATFATRTLQGGGENTLLPSVAFAAVLAGAVAGRVLVHEAARLRTALVAALLVQFGMLFYLPVSLVPSREERARAERLVATLREIEGPVWVASHTSYAWHAGKPWLVHRDPLLDILLSRSPWFPDDLLEKLRRGEFAAVVVDGPFAEPRIQGALEEGYGPGEPLRDPPGPLVGYRTRPALLHFPRPRAAARPAGP